MAFDITDGIGHEVPEGPQHQWERRIALASRHMREAMSIMRQAYLARANGAPSSNFSDAKTSADTELDSAETAIGDAITELGNL